MTMQLSEIAAIVDDNGNTIGITGHSANDSQIS